MKSELNHIAFIPDGNRRWAKRHNLPSIEGHRRGYGIVKNIVDWCFAREIREVSFWGFSTDNWKRSKREVGHLMNLSLRFLTKDIRELVKRDIRLQVVGRRNDLSGKLVKAIEKAEQDTKGCRSGQFNLCFNYGGRSEILEGIRTCLRDELDPSALTSQHIEERLCTSVFNSNIDLIIRTSGEQRLSGFQPWRGTYSELYFSDMHWPDFSEEELDRAVAWYKARDRRFGGDASNC